MRLLQKSFVLLLCFFCYRAYTQSDKIVQRIFLIGDAGELKNGKHPVCDWLTQHVDWNDSTNLLIYLGDNIYPLGMPDAGKGYEQAKAIIDYQLSVVKGKNAKAFFVPGNHDWKQGKPGGWERIKNQEYYINSLELPNVQALPTGGCPGPVDVQVGDKVVLVFMDSQWWLQRGDRPGLESDCDCKNEDEVINALKDILGTYPDKLVITLMHHPLYTHGPHGGYYTLKQHIFPLTDLESTPNLYIPMPVIGSIYPITRGWFGNIQDVEHPYYKDFIARMSEVFKQHPNVIDAAGHEHTLQLLQQDSVTYIVSGAGSKTTRVKKGKNSLFAEDTNGFATLEVSADGKVEVKFYSLASSDLSKPIYAAALKPIPAAQQEIAETEKISLPDSMTVVGMSQLKAGGFKKMMLGKNYRDEWTQEIRVPVIDLSKELGGLTPVKRGGGHQTKTLRLKAANGNQYTLRSVSKSVTDAALPPNLRGVTFVRKLITDGVSASYPYAALSVPPLAAAAGVPHTNPRLVYVADDPGLGKYRKDYGNQVYFLEERTPAGFKKSSSTDEMFAALKKDNDNSVDQKAFLNARLLDMFIMDFDRHEDQWQWADEQKGGGKRFVALPRDRDQPFFISEGILPSFARQNWLAPQVQGFRPKARNIRTFNYTARNVDRNFLNALDEEDWKKEVDEILPKMTDELIDQALNQQPSEIRKTAANTGIAEKLKARKKYYAEEMMTYYRFISKIVSVYGSDKKEQFEITRNDDGSVLVVMKKINKDGELKDELYKRKFDPNVTKEIRIYGQGGDDKFIMNGSSSKIKIRIIGGSGDDSYVSNLTSSNGKTIIYDLNTEKNEFTGNNNFKNKLSGKETVNEYDWKAFKYNTHMPFLSANYNVDDGLYLGAFLRFTRQGFRKSPFSQMHQFSINHALSTKAYVFRYNGEFIDALGKADLLLNADVKAPDNTTNFFSYGNESVFNKNQPGKVKYYRARYSLADFGLALRHKFGSFFNITWGPVYKYYSFDSSDNKNRYILMAPANGLNLATLTKNKSWLGGQLTLGIQATNNPLMPTRGINWQTTLQVLSGLNDFSNNLTQLNSDMAIYMSFSRRAGVVLATRFGAGINFNNNFEFFQAQYLGGTENLRGFRKYRFAGRSMAYNNVEMRIKIADFRTYLFPGSIGILFFHDVGRVWVKNDTSAKWHTGYGGGLWFSPFNRIAITACVTVSEEETLPLIKFGWQF